MTVQRVIRNGKAVVVLQVPDVKVLNKARKVAVEIAMLGDSRGDTLVDAIDDILGDTDEDDDLVKVGTLIDDDEDGGEPTTADEFNDEIPA
jgi:hypothetical protein